MKYADAYDFVSDKGFRIGVVADCSEDDCAKRPVRFTAEMGSTLHEGPWVGIDDLHISAKVVVDQIKKAAA